MDLVAPSDEAPISNSVAVPIGFDSDDMALPEAKALPIISSTANEGTNAAVIIIRPRSRRPTGRRVGAFWTGRRVGRRRSWCRYHTSSAAFSFCHHTCTA